MDTIKVEDGNFAPVVQKLDLKEGDALFIRLPDIDYDASELRRYYDALKKSMPEGVSIVLLHHDMDIWRVRKEDVEKMAKDRLLTRQDLESMERL